MQGLSSSAGVQVPGLELPRAAESGGREADYSELLAAAKKILSDGEQFVGSLRHFCFLLESNIQQQAPTGGTFRASKRSTAE
jgi:hypothetical protein